MNQSSNYDKEEKNAAHGHCMGFVHVIKKGDTLYKLSKQYNVKVSALILANPYVNIYNLQVGDEICIPRMRPAMPPSGSEQMPMVPERPPISSDVPASPQEGMLPDISVTPKEETKEASEIVWEMEKQEKLPITMTVEELLNEWEISYPELEAAMDIIKKIKTLL